LKALCDLYIATEISFLEKLRAVTPAEVQRVSQKYMRNIRFVVLGNPQQIDAVTQEYGVYFVPHQTGPGTQDYVMDHSIYLYLMDPQGKFARAFDTDWSADRIAATLRELMAQFREEGPGGLTEQMRR